MKGLGMPSIKILLIEERIWCKINKSGKWPHVGV